VVAVEEGKGLLLQEEEAGIEQFQVLGKVVQLQPSVSSAPADRRDAQIHT
jgi:hypothetical protein